MKKIVLSILTLLFVNVLTAQNFAPTGAKWNYTYSNFWYFGYVEIESVTDTSVNGADCKKLIKTRETFNYLDNEFLTEDLGYEVISSDEDKVYILRNGQFYTLYDFSADINDTWVIPMTYEYPEEYCDSVGTVQVIAKGDTLIEGQNLRYIVTEPIENSAWVLRGLIIENIGAVEYYLLPEQECVPDIFEGGLFRCYSDEIFDIHDGPYPCTYITLGLNEVSNKTIIHTFPNPATENISFESPNSEIIKQIRIYNSLGQLIENLTVNQSSILWNCQSLGLGIYYYEVVIEEIVYRGKFLHR